MNQKKHLWGVSAVLVLASAAMGCGPQEQPPTTINRSTTASAADYVVAKPGGLAAGFTAAVSANGDTLKQLYPAAGFAVVTTATPAAYEAFGTVVADVKVNWVGPDKKEAFALAGSPPNSNDNDFLFNLQWGHDAVNAPEAWAKGVTGQGVKVAVLDTGFDTDHPDLAPNIDFANSANFVPGESLAYGLPDPFSHGTHTAGTIAAADNGFGTIGVAPGAKLVLVKVLSDSGSGSFSWILQGVVHAADSGAQIISMSLGTYLRNSWAQVMNQVVNYARKKGAIIVASAGNDACDLDHIQECTISGYPPLGGDWRHIPSSLHNVISVSATAPRGWATPAGSNLDFLASYSNYGQSQVDLAGPGGDFVYPGNELCSVDLVPPFAPVVRPCWVFDFVFSTGNNAWYWSAGTSMAAPHVAGVAALILSEEGGKLKPAQLEAAVRKRAADLGKRGNDDKYGQGRVQSGH